MLIWPVAMKIQYLALDHCGQIDRQWAVDFREKIIL